MAKDINIGGRLHSIATGNVVAGADEILDDNLGKKQTQINTETYSLVESVNNALDALSPDQQEALAVATKANANEAKLGYYVCDTDADTAAKTIAATGYVLTTGGNIRIKMTNANTADAVTLNINNTGAKALFYNGTQASSTNSWEAGEVVEVYYDGTQYQASNAQGGGVRKKELIDDEETTAAALGNHEERIFTLEHPTEVSVKETQVFAPDGRTAKEVREENEEIVAAAINDMNNNLNGAFAKILISLNARYKIAMLGDSETSNANPTGHIFGKRLQETLAVTFLQQDASEQGDLPIDSVGNVTTEFGNLAVSSAFATEEYENGVSTSPITLTKCSKLATREEGNVIRNQVYRLLQHTTALGAQITWSNSITGYSGSVDTQYGVGKGYEDDIPDIIWIYIGMNDGDENIGTVVDAYTPTYQNLGNELTTICRSLRWCIETLQTAYPYAMICVSNMFHKGNENVSQRNTIIPELCKKAGVPMVDLWGGGGIGGANRTMYLENGYQLHPTYLGSIKLADYAAGQIKSFYGKLI